MPQAPPGERRPGRIRGIGEPQVSFGTFQLDHVRVGATISTGIFSCLPRQFQRPASGRDCFRSSSPASPLGSRLSATRNWLPLCRFPVGALLRVHDAGRGGRDGGGGRPPLEYGQPHRMVAVGWRLREQAAE